MSFVNISDYEVLKWVCNHDLMDLECHRQGCDGSCAPVALGNKMVGLKCKKAGCGFISKGGLRGFWSKGRIGITKMLAISFTVACGSSCFNLVEMSGIKINKNTWT